MPSSLDRPDRSSDLRRAVACVAWLRQWLVVQKVDRVPQNGLSRGRTRSWILLLTSEVAIPAIESIIFSPRLLLLKRRSGRLRERCLPRERVILANFSLYRPISDTDCNTMEEPWWYSFTPAVTAALLSNSPWKERSGELGSFLLENLFGNLPSSSVPGESRTILGAFPRARHLQSFFGRSGWKRIRRAL